jgi:hypothetical protein
LPDPQRCIPQHPVIFALALEVLYRRRIPRAADESPCTNDFAPSLPASIAHGISQKGAWL